MEPVDIPVDEPIVLEVARNHERVTSPMHRDSKPRLSSGCRGMFATNTKAHLIG